MMSIGQLVLGKYNIVDLIALDGGEGAVAKAVDKSTGQQVAIKQLDADPRHPSCATRVARFRRAAQTQINHPGVVDPIEYGEENGQHYLVMPFIDGVDLGTYIHRCGGKLPVEHAIALIDAFADAVAAIHQKGIIHRDLKPANILVDNLGHIHIVDFGICRNLNEKTIVSGGGVTGTILWLSPEQARNSSTIDQRSDLYALGAIFYFLLTGQNTAQGHDDASVITHICQVSPPSPRQLMPSIPEYVDQACMKLLAKRPEERYQSAEEFRQAIGATLPNPFPTLGPAPASTVACRSCGAPTTVGSTFCGNCGASLAPQFDGGVYCLACGAAVATEAACPNCRRPFSPCDHRLRFHAGPLTGYTFRIPEGQYPVGRESLLERDRHVSRSHLHVSCLNGTVFGSDAGSANKTYVAGQLAFCPLQFVPGCEIRIAGNTAIYSSGAHS